MDFVLPIRLPLLLRMLKKNVNLTARLNKIDVISPRFDVGINDIEKCLPVNSVIYLMQSFLIHKKWYVNFINT